MVIDIKTQSAKRRTAIQRLQGYLKDPGRFSILVLGARGTGKTHWLNYLNKPAKCLEVKAALMNGKNEKEWEKVLLAANNGLLIVDEVEKLDKMGQEMLFLAMETGLGGKFGFSKKKYIIRIVFTSTLEIGTLRDSEKFLLHKFFDRIAQLIVKFPSYQEDQRAVGNDFEATWKKMMFDKKDFPGKNALNWLSQIAGQLHGNFRDLDKIAINWRNLQHAGKTGAEILPIVKEEFEKNYHFPEHKPDMESAFFIKEEMDYYKEIIPALRSFVKDYACRLNNGSIKGKKPFGVSYRTMEGW